MITTNIVEAINCSTTRTIQRLQLKICLEKKPIHRVVRLYPDGTKVPSDVDHDKVFHALAYNMIYRPESSILVDGIMVHIADGLDEESAIDIANKVENKGFNFNLPPSRYSTMIAV